MNTARPLERALLRALRQARRRSPSLAKEDRQTRKRKRSRFLASLGQVWFLLPISMLALGGRAEAGFAALALYAVATSLVRAGELRDDLRFGPDLAVAAALPATDDDLLEAAWWRFFKASFAVLAPLSVAALVAVLPVWNEQALDRRLAAVGVILVTSWSAIVAMASFVATLKGRWPAPFGMALHTTAFATIFFRDVLPQRLPAASWTALELTPGGWIAAAFEGTRNGQTVRGLLWCIPLALLATTLPYSVRRLRREHRIEEITLVVPGHGLVARFESDLGPPVLHESNAQAVGRSEVAEALREDWNSPLERAVALTLHPRERALADFLLGAQPAWTASWKIGLVAWMIAVLAAVVVPSGLSWLVAIACVVGTSALVPIFGGQWPAFELRATSGQFATLVALHPVGFGEAARTILKANAVRIAAALPVVLACGAATLHFLGSSPTAPALYLKVLGLLVCAQPVAVVAKFSTGSNDSNSLAPRRRGGLASFHVAGRRLGVLGFYDGGSLGHAVGRGLLRCPPVRLRHAVWRQPLRCCAEHAGVRSLSLGSAPLSTSTRG